MRVVSALLVLLGAVLCPPCYTLHKFDPSYLVGEADKSSVNGKQYALTYYNPVVCLYRETVYPDPGA